MNDVCKKDWAPFEKLMECAKVQDLLSLPLSMTNEELDRIVPSITLGPEGPRISSIIFLTSNYLGEFRLDQPGLHFDFTKRGVALGIRLEIKDLQIPRENSDPITYRQVEFNISHYQDFRTAVSYVGSDERPWLETMLSIFPVKQLLESRHQ